ncbi:MAG: carbon-nitrogen hydrolase family protein [Bacteroidetes bacterium]|nr:carbon-nitrogen hydrolase family protein [Bacteroidota bacterium]
MILAAAQTKPKRGDIKQNLLDHYRLIKIASNEGVNLIVFPEMSITGYEQENASLLAFYHDDSRLDKLKELAAENEIIIIAGAPLKINSDLFIGEFIIQPDISTRIYVKHFLHPGEEIYFKPSFYYNQKILFDNEKISLAICADIDHPGHAENASKAGSSIYIASIFFSPQGILSAYNSLSGYARKYSMNVLMSNFSGKSWGRPSGGQSAFWDKTGSLIVKMSDSDSGLLVVENINETWTGRTINDKT